MIERSHLRILQALQEYGNLTRAAGALCLSQSALSHQIRLLEQRLGVALWQREGRGLRLTRAGQLLQDTAANVLPLLEQVERKMQACARGLEGVLRIGVECYPCQEWLSGMLGSYMRQLPQVEVDIVNRFPFSGFDALCAHHVDVLVTPDPQPHADIVYQPLLEYELRLLVAPAHTLAGRREVEPEHFHQQVLLGFPVPAERLDILNRFLNPAGVQPKAIRPIQSLELMLQMVALQRGICVLPDWLARQAQQRLGLESLRLGRSGLHKELLLAMRRQDSKLAYIQRFVEIGRELADSLT